MHLEDHKMWDAENYKSCSLLLVVSNHSQACVEEIFKMEKHPVTRTVSIGAICGGTRTSDEFSTARRHSSAGIRALLWAAGSAKSFGCSTDSQTSRENIFSNILTPDSIPQFTIPSLSIQTSLSLDHEADDNKSEDLRSSGTPPYTNISSSSSSSCSSLVPTNRKAERCVSDPLTKRRSLLQREVHLSRLCKDTQHCLDPESKAALSLPHLTKVTTPYGFVTLSQSPQMASEEALLCQAGLRRFNSDKPSCSFSKAPVLNAESIKGNCFHLSGAKKKPPKDSADPPNKERLMRGEAQTSISASVSSSSTPRHPDKLKRRFYHIIKKHFM